MCRFIECQNKDKDSDEESEGLPKVLIAITAIKLRADFALEDIYNMYEIMRKTKYILSNIQTIHGNIKENSFIALKRIDRLSEHLETYRKIVSQINHNFDIKSELKTFLSEIRDIQEMNDSFCELWQNSQTFINEKFNDFNQSFDKITEYKKCAEHLMDTRDHIKVPEVCILCRNDYKYCKDLDQSCNLLCKQSGDQCSDICDKVNKLENIFNQILKQSLDLMQTNKKQTVG